MPSIFNQDIPAALYEAVEGFVDQLRCDLSIPHQLNLGLELLLVHRHRMLENMML